MHVAPTDRPKALRKLATLLRPVGILGLCIREPPFKDNRAFHGTRPGYTRGSGRAPFGALIVGYYEDGRLRCASKVGSGFSQEQIGDIIAWTAQLRQRESPFHFIQESDGTSWSYGLTAWERKSAIWVQPLLESDSQSGPRAGTCGTRVLKD